jgi:catechol 2,3-dioxygenase-like lactoylglutathione lyase family enzyme
MKNWILLAAVWMTGASLAPQTPVSPWAEPHGAFFALSVPDADATAAWYQKQLGFRVISEGEAPDAIARGILLEGHGSLLEIVQHSKAKPLKTVLPHGEAHQIHGIFKIGFHVRDIDSAYKTMTASGAEVIYKLAVAHEMGLRSFTIHDHDGNLLQFFGK